MKNKPYSYFFTYKKICLLYAVKGLNKFIFLLYIYALYEYPVFWTTGFIIFPDEKWAAVVVAGINVRKGAGSSESVWLHGSKYDLSLLIFILLVYDSIFSGGGRGWKANQDWPLITLASEG